MKKAIFIWLLITTAALHAIVSSPTLDRDDLVVSVRAPKTVVPGQFETFILELSNDYDFPLNFKVKIDKPSSWHFLSVVKEVTLQPGEKRNVIFLLEIDRACEIGTQSISFEFVDEEHAVRVKETIVTEVKNIHQVTALAVRKPYLLTGGDDFEVDFEIRNLGNCYEKLSLKTDKGRLSDTALTVAPNSITYITVSQSVPTDLSRLSYISCGVSLYTEYQLLPVREVTTLKAYPKSTSRSDRFHRFPMEATFFYTGTNRSDVYQDGYQIELKGTGFLDRKQRNKLDFVARGPNQFEAFRSGNVDQYSVEYTHQSARTTFTSVRAGDFSFSLTELTEMSRWGRGVGFKHTTSKFEVGGFYNSPRFFAALKDQYGAYGRYTVKENWKIQLSAMQKHYNNNAPTATLGSVINEFSIKNHQVSTEVSMGSRGGKSGLAGGFRADGRFNKIVYRTQNIVSGADFPGYYSNSVLSSSALAYQMNKWGLNADFNYNASNPAQDTIHTTSPYSTNATLGASYKPSAHLRFQLSLVHRAKEDRMPIPKFSYREKVTRYTLSYRNNGWNTQLGGEVGITNNLLVASEDNQGNTYGLNTKIRKNITNNLQVGAMGQYLYTNRYDKDLQRIYIYGANINYNPWRQVSIGASYRNNYLVEDYNQDRTLLGFNVSASQGRHTFSINTSHLLVRNTVGLKDFYLTARYNCKLNAPVSKKQGLYALHGQVKSSNPKDGAGIIINIGGQSVITDQYGRFLINDMSPGLYYLHMDRGTIGIGLVTTVETPMEVEIFPHENNKVIITMVRGCEIKGKIKFEMDQRATMEGTKPGIKVVKATLGEREFLTYSDDKGNFSFKNILPGEWKIRVLHSDGENSIWEMPESTKTISVQAGRTQELEFLMIKKVRKVKFSNQSMDLKIKK